MEKLRPIRSLCLALAESKVCFQGDQMSLWKNCPKCSPTHFLSTNLNRGKSSPTLWATSVIFKTLDQSKQSPNWRKIGPIWSPCLFHRGEQGCQIVNFQNQKFQFVLILEGLGLEKANILFGRLEYITAIWYILWQFGKFPPLW
jgi:hypothetical protein